MIAEIFEKKPQLKEYLYVRGFLITDDNSLDISSYPFYDNWTKTMLGKYAFYINNKTNLYFYENAGKIFFIIGHAYNPFTMQYDENEILKYISDMNESDKYYDAVSELSGVFVLGVIETDRIRFSGDASCMLSAFYGINNEKLYISSHTQLIGDICNLNADDFIKELVTYKYYHLFGRCLPGDLTPYSNFKRVIPNFEYTYENKLFSWKRFFLTKEIKSVASELEYKAVVERCYKILHNNMILISQKWNKPSLSLTGGCDSKTTLSCIDNLSKYDYFSYISVEKEEPDANAAHSISEMLGIQHEIYNIPSEKNKYEDYEAVERILINNCGNIGNVNENDIKKRIFFAENQCIDVEVKSWVSEVARAYYHKRFSKNKLPAKVSPKILTALYKVFIGNRTLAKKVEIVFEEFLSKYYTEFDFDNISWWDLIFWEYRVGAWNGLVITGEHKYSFDITVPYNNRKLLELMLHTPLECRINDVLHKDIQRLGNKLVAECDISVQNVNHTKLRSYLEGLYFDVCSKIII